MKFRQEALLSIERAKRELSSEDVERSRYAALELRMALEALAYERADLYKHEITDDDLKAWQPRKLLSILIDIDPDSDQTVHWSVGKQPEKGVLPEKMQELGQDRRLSLREVKDYYDRLGSYLHNPTLDQLAGKKVTDIHKVKEKCLGLINILESVVESPVFNTRMKATVSSNCLKCKEKIIRGTSPGFSETTATCKNCGAQYSVKRKEQNTVTWMPIVETIPCANRLCNETFDLFSVEIKEGTRRKCRACGDYSVITLGVVHETSSPS